MKMRRRLRIRGEDIWILFFIAGIAAGTIAANQMSEEARSQAGYFAGFLASDFFLTPEKQSRLWHMVLWQRLLEMGIAALVSQTAFSAAAFLLIGSFGGFVSAIMLSVLTYQRGLWGLPLYLASWLPHGIFYLAVWAVLIKKAMNPPDPLYGRRFKPGWWLLLLALLLTGSVLEAYAGPGVLRWVVAWSGG